MKKKYFVIIIIITINFSPQVYSTRREIQGRLASEVITCMVLNNKTRR